MCQGKFLKKDENQDWDLFEALAEKTIQWESCPEKTNPTTSRGGMHSIESSIAAEAKITQLMKRLELLEAREPNSVNQVNPPPVINPGCTYCHALNHLFEECPVYQAQMYPENMNAAYTRPNYNLYSKAYNPGWRNHPNFFWSQSGHEQPKPSFSDQYPAQSHQPSFQQSPPNFQTSFQHNFQPAYQQQQTQNHPDKKMSDLERMIETYLKPRPQ